MGKKSSTVDQFLKITNQIIHDNIDNENFSVEDLAQKTGISRSMLHRKLKNLTGKSARDFITEIRIIRAKELLENDAATASEIAYRVGFKDPSYFNKVFKKHFNVSPGDIRKKVVFDLQPSFEKSLAVLPLHNLTGEPENNYIVDGIQDALIGELGQIKSLRVISRTSTLSYRNREMLLQDIARELGVNTIVEGSVLAADNNLRVIIQLIDVFPKERHILANEYQDEMHNILAIQTEAVKDIAQNIRIKLSKDEEQRITKTRTINPETYKDYMRGLYYFNQGTLESFETGINYMQKAIKRDPGDPFAYGGLALGYAILGHGMIYSKEAFRTAEVAANKALKIDPTLDEAYTALALLNLYNFWKWPEAQEAFENALSRNPNNEIAHAHYAWYHVLFGDKEKSLYHARMATILEPLSACYHSWLGWLCVYFREFEQAEIAARKSLELLENHPFGNVVLGWTYLQKKQYREAIVTHEKLPKDHSFYKVILAYTYFKAEIKNKLLALYEEVEEESKKHWVNPFDRSMLAGMAGYTDQAFELINEAYDNKYYPTNHIDVIIPYVEFLRDDPRYNKLFKRMNLPFNRSLYTAR
jgi:TolB-like protein